MKCCIEFMTMGKGKFRWSWIFNSTHVVPDPIFIHEVVFEGQETSVIRMTLYDDYHFENRLTYVYEAVKMTGNLIMPKNCLCVISWMRILKWKRQNIIFKWKETVKDNIVILFVSYDHLKQWMDIKLTCIQFHLCQLLVLYLIIFVSIWLNTLVGGQITLLFWAGWPTVVYVIGSSYWNWITIH